MDHASTHEADREQAGHSHGGKKVLVIVSHGVTPYGVHFLQRVADELEDFHLRTIYSYEFSNGKWQVEIPASINAVILGRGEIGTVQHGYHELLAGWGRARQLIREISAIHPAAVMIFGYIPVSHFLTIEWLRRNRIPCMLWLDSNVKGDFPRGVLRSIKRVLVTRVMSRCSAYLPCGSLGGQYCQKYGAQPAQIFYVPNEPDYSLIERVTPDAAQLLMREYELDVVRHRLLFSGRLVRVKRVDLLIDAFARLAEDRPDWDLLVVGGGALESELKARIPGRLQSRVTWTGHVHSPEKMAEFYHVADALVLPSDYEPWGVVVSEAAFAGLALVCSDLVGAVPELVKPGVNGQLFRAGDVGSLVAALREVTDGSNLEKYKAASKVVVQNWRDSSDPVRGLGRALDYCLRRNLDT